MAPKANPTPAGRRPDDPADDRDYQLTDEATGRPLSESFRLYTGPDQRATYARQQILELRIGDTDEFEHNTVRDMPPGSGLIYFADLQGRRLTTSFRLLASVSHFT